MSTFALLSITGLGLGALYFMVASGLSLILGLMRVLNLAHGAFLTVAAYVAWTVMMALPNPSGGFAMIVAVVVGIAAGGLFATLAEIFLIRPLYRREVGQILVTVGLQFATISLIHGIFGADQKILTLPSYLTATTNILGAAIPNTKLVIIAFAVALFLALYFFLKSTRYGLIIRAGVENRAMVSALGIDVQKAFTLVFAIGGMAAGLGGVLAGANFGEIDPYTGVSMTLFAIIVVVIGGLGSITGSAAAAIVVGLMQQFLNFYATGVGDFSVVILLAVVLLVRPRGFGGATT